MDEQVLKAKLKAVNVVLGSIEKCSVAAIHSDKHISSLSTPSCQSFLHMYAMLASFPGLYV